MRAIVLLQLDHRLNLEVAQQIFHVTDVGTAKRVDGLIVIAHRKQRIMPARQQFQPLVLQRIGILKFVHQYVFETFLIVFAQRRIARQQFIAAQQQFRKIHHAFALALCIVFGVHLDFAARVRIEGFHLVRPQTLLLAATDEILHLARWIFFVIHIQRLHHPLDR